MIPDLESFVANNYESNYYVPDFDGASNSAESVDDLDLDDVDEIDTNSMAIYSTSPKLKKEKRSVGKVVVSVPGKSSSQQKLKQEPVDTEAPMASSSNVPQSTSQSLLTSSNIMSGNSSDAIDADLMLNVLNDPRGTPSTSGLADTTTSVAQNTLYDDSSRV